MAKFTEKDLQRMCWKTAWGMAIESRYSMEKFQEFNFSLVRFIVWRTKELMKMFDWMIGMEIPED